jgi:chromosome segregation protein
VPLTDKVQSPWAMTALLDGVYVAGSLSQALELRSTLRTHESIITKEGVWISNGWLRVARDSDENAGVLARERDISELTTQSEAQSANLDILRVSIATAREQLLTAEAERDSLQRDYNEAHRQTADLQARLAADKSRLEQERSRSESVLQESTELRTQQADDERERADAQTLLQQALSEIEVLASEREERTRKQQHLGGLLDDAREQARSDQQTMHELALRAESLRTTQQATEHALERMREQCSQLSTRRDELNTILGQGDTPIIGLESELQDLMSNRMSVEQELSGARKTVEDIEHGTRELDQDRIRKERSVSIQREQIEQDRMAWQEVKVRSDTLLEQINEAGFEYKPLLDELDENATVEAWTELAEKLERRINRLGPINLAAIDEFEEESKRKVYLDAQHADLIEALETLENAIAKIDRETRSRFKETFEQVNAGLQENFPTLFGGGHAYLELTGEDMLDTGVTVMARPPGKRNSTIHLLSGGEKALTAIALVFSIFKLNPSPFCMLDEVDAPLDDANVGRYCDMVRKMSEQVQFVFITHNKITMEMANQLMGVTMHEAGVSRLVSVDVDAAVEMVAV